MLLTREVSDSILIKRVELGLTQKDLAKLAGVNTATISALESGRKQSFKEETLSKILNVLDNNTNCNEEENKILKDLNTTLELYLMKNGKESYIQLKNKIIEKLQKI